MIKKVDTTVIIVTAVILMTEALFHYNQGVHNDPNAPKGFVLPSTKGFVKLAGIAIVFSVLNGFIIGQITKGVKA